MKGKKNSSKFQESKRDLLEVILFPHNQRENPVNRETQIIIITRTFRILEDIWKNCGAEEVWNCLRSKERQIKPPKEKK